MGLGHDEDTVGLSFVLSLSHSETHSPLLPSCPRLFHPHLSACVCTLSHPEASHPAPGCTLHVCTEPQGMFLQAFVRAAVCFKISRSRHDTVCFKKYGVSLGKFSWPLSLRWHHTEKLGGHCHTQLLGCSCLVNFSGSSVRESVRESETDASGSSSFPEMLAFLQASVFRTANGDRGERILGQMGQQHERQTDTDV